MLLTNVRFFKINNAHSCCCDSITWNCCRERKWIQWMRSSENFDSCWLGIVRGRRALALEWTRGRCVWDRSWTRGRVSMARECASRRGRPTWCPRRTGGLGSRGSRLRLRPTVVLGLWSIALFFVINVINHYWMNLYIELWSI